MGPNLGCSILKSNQGNLQVKDSWPSRSPMFSHIQQALGESRLWQPDLSITGAQQKLKKGGGVGGGRRAACARGMCHHTPELGQTWERDTPSGATCRRFLNRSARSFMFGSPLTVSVYQQIGVDGDRFCREIHSCIRLRSDISRAAGRPPGAVIHLILRARFGRRFSEIC